MGEIYRAAVRLYQDNFLTLIAIVAVVQIVVAILVQLIRITGTSGALITTAILGLVTAVFAFIAAFLQSGALTIAIADDYLGQPITAERAYAAASDRLGALIGTSLLVGIAVLAMAITVIGIPFAIYFGIRWAFIAQVVMVENLAGGRAMRRSADLVSGSWWRTFGILLLMGILIGIVAAIVESILARLLGTGALDIIVNLVIQILLAPLYSAVLTLLYFDQRIRKEQMTHDMLAGDVGSRSVTPGGYPGTAPL